MRTLNDALRTSKVVKRKPMALRGRTSQIYRFCLDLTEIPGQYPQLPRDPGDNLRYFICKPCSEEGAVRPTRFVAPNSHQAFKNHLLLKHGIAVETIRQASDRESTRSSSRITDYEGFGLERDEDMDGTCACERVDKNSIRALALAWIVEDNLPFSLVESKAFRRFISTCAPRTAALLPRSHVTIRKDLQTVMQYMSEEVRASLAAAKSKIHLVFDAWTSPAQQSIFGVVARYVTTDFKLSTLL